MALVGIRVVVVVVVEVILYRIPLMINNGDELSEQNMVMM
jgi:hypothetical protein